MIGGAAAGEAATAAPAPEGEELLRQQSVELVGVIEPKIISEFERIFGETEATTAISNLHEEMQNILKGEASHEQNGSTVNISPEDKESLKRFLNGIEPVERFEKDFICSLCNIECGKNEHSDDTRPGRRRRSTSARGDYLSRMSRQAMNKPAARGPEGYYGGGWAENTTDRIWKKDYHGPMVKWWHWFISGCIKTCILWLSTNTTIITGMTGAVVTTSFGTLDKILVVLMTSILNAICAGSISVSGCVVLAAGSYTIVKGIYESVKGSSRQDIKNYVYHCEDDFRSTINQQTTTLFNNISWVDLLKMANSGIDNVSDALAGIIVSHTIRTSYEPEIPDEPKENPEKDPRYTWKLEQWWDEAYIPSEEGRSPSGQLTFCKLFDKYGLINLRAFYKGAKYEEALRQRDGVQSMRELFSLITMYFGNLRDRRQQEDLMREKEREQEILTEGEIKRQGSGVFRTLHHYGTEGDEASKKNMDMDTGDVDSLSAVTGY